MAKISKKKSAKPVARNKGINFVEQYCDAFVQFGATRSNTASEQMAEVVAVAPGVGNGEKNRSSFTLTKDCKDYTTKCAELIQSQELSTAAGSTCLVRLGGLRKAKNLLFVGLGKEKKNYDFASKSERLRQIGGAIARKLVAEKQSSANVVLDSFLNSASNTNVDVQNGAQALAEGIGLACYRFDKYFSKKKEQAPLEINFVANDAKKQALAEKGLERARATIAATHLARDLGNEPSNELTPKLLAESAHKVAGQLGLKCQIFAEADLKKEKMGLLLGVGQGSAHPPRLIVLEYSPKAAKKAKTVALVGKGITFDSGGISIKPSSRMEDMKHDMCGAAAVIGAICLAALNKVEHRVIAVVAAAENMPSGQAICPGNILVSRAGKTVEITNTDAEGRLVLADALDFVQDLNPDYIVDAATLTGAVSITPGKACSGLMANDAGIVKKLRDAALDSGERVWELPMYEEYFDDLKSDYADMRNSGDTASHGTAKGAKFLEQFIRKGVRWAHLDIAAVAYNLGSIPYMAKKGATGYGVRLLNGFLSEI